MRRVYYVLWEASPNGRTPLASYPFEWMAKLHRICVEGSEPFWWASYLITRHEKVRV